MALKGKINTGVQTRIIREYLNYLLSLVKSGLIYCAAAVQVAGAKKWDVSRPSIGTLGNYSSLVRQVHPRRFSYPTTVR